MIDHVVNTIVLLGLGLVALAIALPRPDSEETCPGCEAEAPEDTHQRCPGCGLLDPFNPNPQPCAVCAPQNKENQK